MGARNEYSFLVMSTQVIHSQENAKVEALMAAALRLFAEQGFYGTTVPEIATAAKVGAGTVYRYFESKEAIVNAVYQRWKLVLVMTLMGEFPFDAPGRVQFEHFVSHAFKYAREHPLAFRFLEMHHHMAYLDATSLALEGKVIEPARAFFEQQNSKAVTRDAPSGVLGGLVWGAIVGLIKAVESGYAEMTPEAEKQAIDVLWAGIRRK